MTDRDLLEEAIDAYHVPAPPAGLAERVARAVADSPGGAADPGVQDPPSRRRLPWRALPIAVFLAAAVASASFLLLRPGEVVIRAGASAPAVRQSIALGTRAKLVVEAGSQVRWWPARESGGEIVIEQRQGSVFYRVDAGPLTVETPRGTVHVLGTCFRLEVTDMKIDRHALAGAAVGAALAGAVVVTVYEGRVSLANGRGRLEVSAGQSAQLPSGEPPHLAGRADPATRTPPPAFHLGPPSLRDTTALGELQALRARVARQDEEIARLRTGHPHSGSEKDTERFVDPPPDELQARAARCEISFVTPNLDRDEPAKLSDRQAKQLGLSDTEREAADEVMRDIHAQVPIELRKLYLEVSNDTTTASRLSASTLFSELLQKTPGDLVTQSRIRLSRERAGLIPPPANLAATPPVERALRIMAGLADDYERRLSERIGADRARSLRALRKLWGSHSTMAGCPDRD